MKNNLIKLIFIVLGLIFYTTNVSANIVWPNIKVKIDWSWNETYTTILDWISNNNTILNFEVTWLYSWTSTWSYSINMPSWFEYISYDITQSTCNNIIISNYSNTNFNYKLNPNNQTCISKIILNYKATNAVVTNINHKINIFDSINSTNISNVQIKFSSLFSLINSETFDLNSNWYIDSLKLIFNTNSLSNFSNLNLKFWTITPLLQSVSWSSAILTINDSIYKTWDKPSINDTDWLIFNNIWIITNVVPEDKANPILEKINWNSINSNIYISWISDIILTFSEKLLPSSSSWIFLKKWSNIIATNNTFTDLNTLNINPISTLDAWIYSIYSDPNIAKDWSLNWNSLNIDFNTLIVSDNEWPIWQSLWSSTWIIINSWNSKTNNISVQLWVFATDNIGVTQMKIWNSPDVSDWEWITYTTNKFNHNIVWTIWINTVYVKFKDNEWNESNIYSDTIEYDNSNDYIQFNNINSNYTKELTISLNWTCNFTWEISPLIILKNWLNIVWTTSCNTTTKTFSNVFNLNEWINSIEASFSWTSIIWNIEIYKDTISPNITITPTNSSNNSQIAIELLSNDIFDIYYTLDWTTPNKNSNLYKDSFSLNENKTIKYYSVDLAWNEFYWSKSYTFSCNSVSNWTNSSYPSCQITCNNWYYLNSWVCILQNIPSSGWGSSGWWWWTTITDIENYKYISQTKIEITETINNTIKKYWVIDLNKKTDNNLTLNNWNIEIRSSLKWLSKLIIWNNTTIISNSKTIYWPHSYEIKADLKLSDLKINNKIISSFNIKKLFFAWNLENEVVFNKDIWIELNLWWKIDWSLYVYYSDKIDWNFSLIKNWIITDENWIISFNYNKLWYFAIIRDIYIDRYFWTQSIVSENIDTKIETEKLIQELKNTIVNTNLNSLIDLNSQKLIIPEIDYYLSFDSELREKYFSVFNWLKDFIINTDKYLTTKDSKYKILAAEWFKNYSKVNELKNFEEKYIIKTNRDWLLIYKTTYTPIAKLVDALENAMIIKLNKLLEANTINQEQYNQTIKNYNDFILHLSIYRQYKNKAAALKALTPGRGFLKVYKMRVIYIESEQNNNTVDTNINNSVKPIQVENKILIKDKYSFPKELKFWDYNIYVQNLQEILKSYWYFNHPQTTQYFWNVTKESLILFSKEILKTENPNWILSNDIIKKLYLVEYK